MDNNNFDDNNSNNNFYNNNLDNNNYSNDYYNDNIDNNNNINNSNNNNSNNTIAKVGLVIIGIAVLACLFIFKVIPGPFSNVSSKDIAFTEKVVKVKRFSGVQLSLTGNTNVRYKSSDDSIATVNELSGYVTGNKNGTVTITAYNGNDTIDTCTVEVYTDNKVINITGLKLSDTNISLYVGNSKQLKVTISPSNATNRKIIWSTSDKNIATIDNNGIVVAKKVGTAVIKVRTESGVEATCKVTVKNKSTPTPVPTPTPTPTTKYTLTYNANGGTVSPTSNSLKKGATLGTLPTPTRSGYTFNGWYTAANGGSKVGSSTTINGNMTIYAHWTKNAAPAPTPTVDKIHFIKQASSNSTDKELNNGDAILLESNGHFAMVDTGLNNATDNKYVLDYIKSVGVKKLDFIFISHFHRDHMGGLSHILNNIPVSRIYMKTYLGKDKNKDLYKPLFEKIKQQASSKGIPITYIDKSYSDGQGFNFQDMRIRFYNTKQNNNKTVHYDANGKVSSSAINENSNTVLALINVNGYKVLLTGDLYDEKNNISLLKSLSKTSDFKNLDVLKMPHHGSTRSAFGGTKKGSYNKEAFKNLNPKYVVVTSTSCSVCKSVGATKNVYYARNHKGTIFTFGSSIKIDYK